MLVKSECTAVAMKTVLMNVNQKTSRTSIAIVICMSAVLTITLQE